MSAIYLWQQARFPQFEWDAKQILPSLSNVRNLQGQLLGRMAALGFEDLSQQVETLTSEVMNSSQIEGVTLNADSVRSSIARHLGVVSQTDSPTDHYTEGVVTVMMQATQNYSASLTEERLFAWHAAFFPTGYSDGYKITVANWRVGYEPMQVVSGPIGKEKIHFVGPPSDNVPEMMTSFMDWINSNDQTDNFIRAAIAHLWFVTIHPFDDGNGRMARTITEMLLSRADESSKRFYSLSAEIMRQRTNYYNALEHAQHGSIDVTEWILWFLSTLSNAIETALRRTDRILQKTNFWQRHNDIKINERQRKLINRLWDGFEGKLTTQKYAKINHCSQDTALRDIQQLIDLNILRKTHEGGRSTNYALTAQ